MTAQKTYRAISIASAGLAACLILGIFSAPYAPDIIASAAMLSDSPDIILMQDFAGLDLWEN